MKQASAGQGRQAPCFLCGLLQLAIYSTIFAGWTEYHGTGWMRADPAFAQYWTSRALPATMKTKTDMDG